MAHGRLVQRAVGDQLTCVFVDHGLLRKDEAEQVERDFVAATGVSLKVGGRALGAASWTRSKPGVVATPRRSARSSGWSRVHPASSEQAEREILADAASSTDGEPVEFLVQGTLYPDVVESGGGAGTANIKSHHNVGGLPEDLHYQLIEPLRKLFKDEVRKVGEELGLPREIVHRQPYPGPGLGIRIVGEVTQDRLDLLREADAIAREELTAAGLDREIWQCPVVLLADVRSVGVQGDGPHLRGHLPVVLRPGLLRGRDDGGLVPAALRGARPDLQPHHQRGARRQPRRAGRRPRSPRPPSSGSSASLQRLYAHRRHSELW